MLTEIRLAVFPKTRCFAEFGGRIMNFEFLKELRGMGNIYENCNNAERLAITMPVQSVFTSRKSAELLAKFIYMAAHNQEMEEMTFLDILSDSTFRRFIGNRGVIDAFHYIRKSGNRAAHVDEQETPEDAINVLRDLHYVAGETAHMLGLIKNYPYFEENIKAFPEEKYVPIEDVNEKALEMFFEYVQEYDAQQERAQYTELGTEAFLTYAVEGNVDLHEYLEFKHKPGHVELMEYLQDYLFTLTRLSIERSPEKAEELELSNPVTLDVKIVIGDKTYYSSDLDSFAVAIVEELPKAEGFVIDCMCKGSLREFYHDEPDENGDYSNTRINMIRKDAVWNGTGMIDKLESYKRREQFTYYSMIFYPDSGNIFSAAIIDGKSKEVSSLFSEDILSYSDLVLYCDGLSIHISGKKELKDCPEAFEAFKEIIRDNVDESNIHFCEEAWNPDDINYIEGCLIPFVQIQADTVGEYEAFLNKLNRCMEPWKDVFWFVIDEPNLEEPIKNDSSNILYDIPDLSLAVVEIRNGELHLTGTVLGKTS